MAKCEKKNQDILKINHTEYHIVILNSNKTGTMHTAEHSAWELSLLNEKEDFYFLNQW